jgi:dipeptidase E
MRFYLSSYKLGNEPEKLVALFSNKRSVGYIPNALDFTQDDLQRRKEHIEKDMAGLKEIGLAPKLLDLRGYFANQEVLRNEILALGGLWISGGNVFVLRQAMKLCGLDNTLIKGGVPDAFVYAGYSAAGCVLSANLKGYSVYSATVSDATDLPYKEQKETIWEGLNLIPFLFMPHYDSLTHPQAEEIQKEVAYYKECGILYSALRDGEAIVITEKNFA